MQKKFVCAIALLAWQMVLADEEEFFMPDISEVSHRQELDKLLGILAKDEPNFRYKVAKEKSYSRDSEDYYAFLLNNFEHESETNKMSCFARYSLEREVFISSDCESDSEKIAKLNKDFAEHSPAEQDDSRASADSQEESDSISDSVNTQTSEDTQAQDNDTDIEESTSPALEQTDTQTPKVRIQAPSQSSSQSDDSESVSPTSAGANVKQFAEHYELKLEDISYQADISKSQGKNCVRLTGNGEVKNFCFTGDPIRWVVANNGFFSIETYRSAGERENVVYYTFRLMDGEIYLHQYSKIDRLMQPNAQGSLDEKTYIYYRSKRDAPKGTPNIKYENISDKNLQAWEKKHPKAVGQKPKGAKSAQSEAADLKVSSSYKFKLEDIEYTAKVGTKQGKQCLSLSGNGEVKNFCFTGDAISKVSAKDAYFSIETTKDVQDRNRTTYYTFRLMDGEIYLHQYSRETKLLEPNAQGDLDKKVYIYYRSKRDAPSGIPNIRLEKLSDQMLKTWEKKYPKPVPQGKK